MSEKWATLDCGKFPSEKNCRIKMTSPADDIEELLAIAFYHAIRDHGHQETPELREKLINLIEYH